jgi:predicted small integral membrane protein
LAPLELREVCVIVRLAKIACVAALALFVALVALGNVTDYWTNFAFVAQVLDMDGVLADAAISWRAATSPALHQLAYLAIIATEIAVAALTTFGAVAMIRALRAAGQAFQRAKNPAILGLALGFLLFEGGFIAIAGGMVRHVARARRRRRGERLPHRDHHARRIDFRLAER